jgi:hypothetical protein
MIFGEKEHTYEQGNRAFTPVTTFLHSFEKPKDWDKIARKYSKDHKIPLEEVLKKWQHEKDISLVRGTAYHALKEKEVNDSGTISVDNIECKVKFYPQEDGFVTQHDCKLENNTVYTEMMVWDEEAEICGKFDRLSVVDGVMYLEDHKTNKEIKKKGFYVKNVGTEKLLPPVAHLDNCNWNIYCLQLSLYMYMLWKKNKNFRIAPMKLNHVKFDNEGNVTGVEVMQVPYLRTEVINMLEAWKTKNK